MATGTIIAVISLVVGAVGAGVSYSAQQSAAKSQSLFATLNAQSGLQQTQAQGRAAALQANLAAAKADAAQKSANNNAQAIREQTEMESRVNQENIRKSREKFRHDLSANRAALGSSGIVDTTGSPLDLLVNAAEDQSLFESEQRWSDENNRRKGFRLALAEEYQGRAQGLNSALYQLDAAASLANSRMEQSQIRLNKFSQLASARGASLSATGGLISNIGGLAGNAYGMYQRTPTRTTS